MSIPLKRFQSLDSDFHVGVGDFKSQITDAMGTLNAADAFISEKNSEMQAAVGQLKKEIQEAKGVKDAVMGAANDAIANVTRFTKDLGQEITDMTGIPEKYINGVLDDIFGTADGLGTKMKGLVKTCRNQALTRAGLGNNRFANPRCGGLSMSAGQCSSSGASGILSSSTAGIFTKAFGAVNNLIKKVMSLAGLGFNSNLCNVMGPLLDTAFGAAGGLFDSIASATGVKTLITGTMGNVQALLGNVGAVSDIAKNVAGLGVSSFLPVVAKNVLNMKSPRFSSATQYASVGGVFYGGFNQDVLAEGRSILGSAQLFDSNVFKSKDGLPSVAAFDYDSPLNAENPVVGSLSDSVQRLSPANPGQAASLSDSMGYLPDTDSIGTIAPSPDNYAGWF